jgi:hypothetical protein
MLMSSVFSQENSVNKESEGQTAETRCTIVLTGLIVILVLFLLLLWCFASFFSKESLSEIREKRGPRLVVAPSLLLPAPLSSLLRPIYFLLLRSLLRPRRPRAFADSIESHLSEVA